MLCILTATFRIKTDVVPFNFCKLQLMALVKQQPNGKRKLDKMQYTLNQHTAAISALL